MTALKGLDPMQRLLFSINSGRSGSDYLYRLFATAGNARAFHEAKPDMAGRYVSAFPATNPTVWQRLCYPAMYVRKLKKVRAIREVLQTMGSDLVYAETNHMFILSFYDVVMRHFRHVDVVLIRRYLPHVVKSFMDLNMFVPEDRRRTPYWTCSPNSPSAAVRALAPDVELDRFDRCIGYVIDIEARAQRFMATYPQSRVIAVRLEELNDWGNVQRLFDQAGLEATDETRSAVGRVVNQMATVKTSDTSAEYCLERIHQYIEKCRAKGITLPELPHLMKI